VKTLNAEILNGNSTVNDYKVIN